MIIDRGLTTIGGAFITGHETKPSFPRLAPMGVVFYLELAGESEAALVLTFSLD